MENGRMKTKVWYQGVAMSEHTLPLASHPSSNQEIESADQALPTEE